MPAYFVVYKERNFNFCYTNVIVKYGKANRSGEDACENLVYYITDLMRGSIWNAMGGEG